MVQSAQSSSPRTVSAPQRVGRAWDAMREVVFTVPYTRYAEGSCLAQFGHTHVVCTATVEEKVPPFLRNTGSGWITAEYGMLPRATHARVDREASKGKQSGRTQEIQRLIGRSLRAVVDLKALGERQIRLDCDVLQADGGTRTAAISGSYVALAMAISSLMKRGVLAQSPIKAPVAAVSCGIVGGHVRLDLDYEEDSQADVDANFVIMHGGALIELQATAEHNPFDQEQFLRMLALAQAGTQHIFACQQQALVTAGDVGAQRI